MCSLLPVVNGSLEFYVSFPRTAIEGAAELCVRFPCFAVEGYPNIPWQRSGLKQRALSTIETEDERKTRLVELRGQIRNERSALRPTTSITSTRVRNFNICGSLQGLDCGKCEIWMGSRVTVNGTLKEEISLVNGDGDNDVTEVYPNDDDNQHDVGFEDGDEVEIMMISGFQSYLCRTIKLRVIDCKEMITLLIYTVLKYCSGSVWLVSYCPSTVDFSCSCMRMQSIGLPCDHILVVLDSLNFMELPSSLVLNRWSKVATENIKDKYLDSAMYWDSQLMAKYATLVEVSRQVCKAAYRDEDEYDKMLHFLSNEVRRLKSKKNSEPCIDDNDEQADQQGDNYDGILDPVVVRIKGCRQVGVDEYGKQRRIQKCGQCGGSGHNKRSCRNRLRNANVCVDGLFISSSEQTNTMCQPTDEYNYELLMQQPHTFVAGSSRPGPLRSGVLGMIMISLAWHVDTK
ncbi:hypothetical protein JHK87_009728 [Glycine soja]|nr:hypothetical protein JHK87_009728 [Glycine soja]